MKIVRLLIAVGLLNSALVGAPPSSELVLPSTESFTKLRMSYAQKNDFSPMWKVGEKREAILAAQKANDAAKVAALSKEWLEEVPVDADIHFVRAQALRAMGDWAGYAYHWHCFYGLLHSVASSGDGKTPETAFKVISVAEEYYLLDELGAELIQQKLQFPCDVMHVKLRDGSERHIYFDITISFEAMSRQLDLNKGKK